MKQKLKGGFEWDWTGKYRHIHKWGAGVGKYIKRRMNKRFRKEWKNDPTPKED
jgi:hypothetical protein